MVACRKASKEAGERAVSNSQGTILGQCSRRNAQKLAGQGYPSEFPLTVLRVFAAQALPDPSIKNESPYRSAEPQEEIS